MARGTDDPSQRLPGQVDQRHRQFVDVAELAIEAVRGDAGLARDLAQAEAGHAAMRADQAQGGGQQVLAGNRGLADRRVRCRRWSRGWRLGSRQASRKAGPDHIGIRQCTTV
jgi:hypothetical protein